MIIMTPTSASSSNEDDAPNAGSTPSQQPQPRRRKRLSRKELMGETRAKIFRAAMEVVSQHGYAGATVGRVTEVAGIAQGTFYLYFESRQTLLDELLPYVGVEMLDFIREHTRGARDVFDMEERGFRAFFDYMRANPGFSRLIREAEFAAPVAYAQHHRHVEQRYIEALRRAVENGEIRDFASSEIETVVYVLLAARSYLYNRYAEKADGTPAAVPEHVVRTYMKIVRGGLR